MEGNGGWGVAVVMVGNGDIFDIFRSTSSSRTHSYKNKKNTKIRKKFQIAKNCSLLLLLAL